MAELQERYRSLQSGEVECIPVDEAKRQARESASEIERLWLDEAERRLEEYHSGNVVGIPADEVFKRALAELTRTPSFYRMRMKSSEKQPATLSLLLNFRKYVFGQ